MKKSYWLKDQNGNFSNEKNDSFDHKRGYIGIRLQQGIPLLDRDWNELEDMRRYEEMILRKWYLGNGTPDADSFKISAANPPGNDFKIAKGRCLVDGFEAVNKPPEEASYILYSKQDNVAALNKPSEDRTDIVFLDIWIEEVTSEEEKALKNSQDVKMETCIRHKLQWRVRVDEGSTGYNKKEYHHYYDIAKIHRKANRNILASYIEDLRNTGLAVYLLREAITLLTNNSIADAQHRHSKLVGSDGAPDPALSVDNNGNVGIGTTNPEAKLHVRGSLKLNIGEGLEFLGENDYFGTYLDARIFRMIDSNGVNGNVDGGIAIEGFTPTDNNRKPIMAIKGNGNVGIGTTSPEGKLDVFSEGDSGAHLIMNSYAITLKGVNNPVAYKPRLPYIQWRQANNIRAMYLGWGDTNSKYIDMMLENGFNLSIRGGNVGIGTTNPEANLHVVGSLRLNIGEGLEFLGENDYFGTYVDARIFRMIDSNGVNGNVDGGIAIEGFTPTDNNRKPIMAIKGNGNVGIGTKGPETRLEVQGGSAKFVTSNGNDPLIISRFHGISPAQGTQELRIGVGDGVTTLHYINDEAMNKLDFRMQNTDTETGGGANANNNVVMSINGNKDGGNVWAKRRSGGGIDYAEYFESIDGKKIPSGTSVVLDGDKIRTAKKKENPIGIISANPGIAGGVHIEWPKKYLRDEFGNLILREYKEEIMKPKTKKVKKEHQKIKTKKVKEEVTRTEIVLKKGKYCQKEITEKVTHQVEEPVYKEVDLYDAGGKNIIGKHQVPVMETYEEEIEVLDENGQPIMVGTGKFVTKKRPKLNPKYNKSKEYIPREKRPEWNCVGLLGQLPLRKGQPVAPTWVKIKSLSKDVELWLVK